MDQLIDNDLKELINDERSLKALASVDPEGAPHVTYKASIFAEAGQLRYLELIESSLTNRNLVHSLWFNKPVAVNVLGGAGRSVQIKGRPVRAIIYGREFRRSYVEMKDRLQADLAAIWLIEPLEVREETFSVRQAEESRKHPLFRHLDFLLKPGGADSDGA